MIDGTVGTSSGRSREHWEMAFADWAGPIALCGGFDHYFMRTLGEKNYVNPKTFVKGFVDSCIASFLIILFTCICLC